MNVQKFYHSKALAQEDLSAMFAAILEDEGSIMQKICAAHQADSMTSADAQQATIRLVEKIRSSYKPAGPIEAMLLEYDLSTEEGIALMCLGEALMRVPDKHTQDLLIKEKLTTSDWQKASGKSGMMVANAASWGLMLGGKILDDKNTKNLWAVLQKMVSKLVSYIKGRGGICKSRPYTPYLYTPCPYTPCSYTTRPFTKRPYTTCPCTPCPYTTWP